MRFDRALIAGFALAFTPGFNVANVGAVADTASRQYGVGLGVIGLFTTALFLSHAAMQVPMGRLCDRLGARIVGVVGLVGGRRRLGGRTHVGAAVVRDRDAVRRRVRHGGVVRRR